VGSWDLRLQRYLLAIPGSGASDNDTVWAFHFGTNEAQLISQGQLYKRSQPVSVWGQFLRRTPMTLADLPVELQRVPGELGDPALSGAFPVIVSGDYSGGVHEQELLTDDDGEAVHAHVEFGPFPKDPIMVAHIGKVLTEVRFRGKLASGSSMNVKVRPTHKSTWTALPTPVAFQGDHFTVKVDGSGVEGEQFFIRLEDMGQYSWTRLHSMCLMGTHTGRPWKP
jgi:hypothetical protein